MKSRLLSPGIVLRTTIQARSIGKGQASAVTRRLAATHGESKMAILKSGSRASANNYQSKMGECADCGDPIPKIGGKKRCAVCADKRYEAKRQLARARRQERE